MVIGFRIYDVNANAVQLEVQHYDMDEWVELNGAFLDTKDGENTEGYSIKVKNAKLMSYNEFVSKYCEKDEAIEGLDNKSVIDLEIEIKNVGNEDGYILILMCKLISEKKNYYLNTDSVLWSKAEPNVDEYAVAFCIKKDTEYTTHIPYTINVTDLEQYKKPIEDRNFELILSNSPVRKVVDIQIQDMDN